jgi:hypothetical protein
MFNTPNPKPMFCCMFSRKLDDSATFFKDVVELWKNIIFGCRRLYFRADCSCAHEACYRKNILQELVKESWQSEGQSFVFYFTILISILYEVSYIFDTFPLFLFAFFIFFLSNKWHQLTCPSPWYFPKYRFLKYRAGHNFRCPLISPLSVPLIRC